MKCAVEQLAGLWDVQASGPAAPLNLLGDQKYIDGDAGYNIINGERLGFFSVRQNGLNIILNYDDERNPRVLRAVRDYVAPTTVFADVWDGSLYWHGKYMFGFELIQVETP